MAVIFHLHTMHVPQPFELPTRSFASHPLCAMSSHQPPSEGSATSFWASVYTHERPNVLCGVITDINLHRFTLHQHLTTHRALTETPLLHPPFQQALPDALHTFNFIPAVSTRLRSTCAGHSQPLMPCVYLQELESTVDDDSASEILLPTPNELLPGHTIHLPPITRHSLGGISPYRSG